jgi:hypothetical protein
MCILRKGKKLLPLGLMILTSSCSYFKPSQEIQYIQAAEPTPIAQPEEYLQGLEGLEEGLQSLFARHGMLLNNAIIAAVEPDAHFEDTQAQLSENTQEIANLLGCLYGTRIAHRFKELWCQHTQLQLCYIRAVKAHQTYRAKQIAFQIFKNGDLLVEFINKVNPFFAQGPEGYMFEEHIKIEIQQTQAYVLGNFAQAEELKERSITQLEEMAHHLAQAIDRQMIDMCE